MAGTMVMEPVPDVQGVVQPAVTAPVQSVPDVVVGAAAEDQLRVKSPLDVDSRPGEGAHCDGNHKSH